MATLEVVSWVCDLCGKDLPEREDVESHVVAVDGRAVSVDACGDCWGRVWDVVSPVLDQGRPYRRQKKKSA